MRTRERNNIVTTSNSMARTRVHSTNGTSHDDISYQNGPFEYGSYETMTDKVIPGYHERSKRGEVFINPLGKHRWERTISGGGFSFQNDPQNNPYFEDTYKGYYAIDRKGGTSGHASVPIDVLALQKEAGTKAQADIDSPEFEGLVFAGELNETLRFLRSPLRGFGDFLKDMRRRKNASRFQKGKTVAQFAGDSWLSYRYGVRPLVNDAQNAIEAVRSVAKKQPLRRTARGYASASDSIEQTELASQYSANVEWTTNTNRELSVRCGVLYELHRRADTFGVSVSQIPSAAWELIPFSFVADWFVNIGPYVRAITPKVGVKVLGNWTTTQDIQQSFTTSFVKSMDDKDDVILNPGHCQEQYLTEDLTRAPGLTIGLTHREYVLRNGLDIGKIVDSVALIDQLLRSK